MACEAGPHDVGPVVADPADPADVDDPMKQMTR